MHLNLGGGGKGVGDGGGGGGGGGEDSGEVMGHYRRPLTMPARLGMFTLTSL